MPLLTTGAGVYITSGGGGTFTPTSTQSSNFLTRVAAVTGTGNPTYGISTAERNAYDTMITSMVADGTWSLLDCFWMFATATRSVAVLNLISSSFTCVEHGVGAGQFTADVGYTGVASGYLDTQFVGNGGTNFVVNSASMWAWTSTNFSPGTDYGSMGQCDGSASTGRLYPHYSDNNFYSYMAGYRGDTATGQPGHFYGTAATSSSSVTQYIDTTATTTTYTSNALGVGNLFLLADDASGTSPFQGNLGCFLVGGAFNSTQQGTLHSRISTFMSTV